MINNATWKMTKLVWHILNMLWKLDVKLNCAVLVQNIDLNIKYPDSLSAKFWCVTFILLTSHGKRLISLGPSDRELKSPREKTPLPLEYLGMGKKDSSQNKRTCPTRQNYSNIYFVVICKMSFLKLIFQR
jgi:hypothetical protein